MATNNTSRQQDVQPQVVYTDKSDETDKAALAGKLGCTDDVTTKIQK